MPTPSVGDVKVFILMYAADRNELVAYIPVQQDAFIDRLHAVIQQMQQQANVHAASSHNMQQMHTIQPSNGHPQGAHQWPAAAAMWHKQNHYNDAEVNQSDR